jgi:hypothetical protein
MALSHNLDATCGLHEWTVIDKTCGCLTRSTYSFGAPFRCERKEGKLDIHTLALCKGIRTNQGINSIPCVNQTRRKKTCIPRCSIILFSLSSEMMRSGIAKHACHEEVRFHTH